MEDSSNNKPSWLTFEMLTDATEHPLPLLVVIEQMSPGEVVALWREAEARHAETEENEEYGEDEVVSHGDFVIDLDCALMQLPQRNLVHARAVYAAFAESPLDDDRQQGAHIVYTMPRVDREYGLRLWNQLMRDQSSDVRRQAKEGLDIYLERDEYAEKALNALGLSWLDAYRLLDAYANAERGFNVHNIGAVALQRAVDHQKEQPQ